MRVLTLVLAFLVVLLPLLGQAQDWTQGEFDARYLTTQGKRIVRAALTFSGDYVGFIDGGLGVVAQP